MKEMEDLEVVVELVVRLEVQVVETGVEEEEQNTTGTILIQTSSTQAQDLVDVQSQSCTWKECCGPLCILQRRHEQRRNNISRPDPHYSRSGRDSSLCCLVESLEGLEEMEAKEADEE